jgi:hypothetical protein
MAPAWWHGHIPTPQSHTVRDTYNVSIKQRSVKLVVCLFAERVAYHSAGGGTFKSHDLLRMTSSHSEDDEDDGWTKVGYAACTSPHVVCVAVLQHTFLMLQGHGAQDIWHMCGR